MESPLRRRTTADLKAQPKCCLVLIVLIEFVSPHPYYKLQNCPCLPVNAGFEVSYDNRAVMKNVHNILHNI